MTTVPVVILLLHRFVSLWLVLPISPCFASRVVPLSKYLAGSRPNTSDTLFLDYLASMSIHLPDYHSEASVCNVFTNISIEMHSIFLVITTLSSITSTKPLRGSVLFKVTQYTP